MFEINIVILLNAGKPHILQNLIDSIRNYLTEVFKKT